MNWEAANLPKSRRGDDRADGGDAATKRRSTETVEAALSRLGKAYATSMECIGALNKTSHVLLKQPSVTDEQFETLLKLSKAARNTFEDSILLDPLIVPLMPTLHETMHDYSQRKSTENKRSWVMVQERRASPPILSSVAHKNTVRDYAYLSLVNYGDLLQSACACQRVTSSEISILDKGIVKPLRLFQNRNHCCWEGESLEDTLRLAVTAYCDASKLDGSDPTLWLKLASATRGLERLLVQPTDSWVIRSRYRRLQRYALECGSRALAPNLPPNRMVTRALRELNEEQEPTEYPATLLPDPEASELHLELPRYSWSVLGRMLTRACREGSHYVPHDMTHHHHGAPPRAQSRSTLFGSPSVVLDLSPMLVMPSRVLGTICQYLEQSSIWRFEATCRALSVSIMAARTAMEEESKRKPSGSIPQKAQIQQEERASEPSELHQLGSDGNQEEEKVEETEVPPARRARRETSESSRSSSRASKRLKSQQITTGKREARNAKRTSLDYCFLASVLSCTQEEHRQNVTALGGKAITDHVFKDDGLELDKSSSLRNLSMVRDPSSRHRNEARERTGPSSLSQFAQLWSRKNSGPLDLLGRFLGHVAMNVEDVFGSDPAGPSMLSSCLQSCFELYLGRSGAPQGCVPHFFQSPACKENVYRSLELLAIDLLHAELILRQCDRYTPECVEFDDDSNLISLMVPQLLLDIEELQNALGSFELSDTNTISQTALRLKIRINWLAAGFMLWRSRIADEATESRVAEEEGLRFIMEASNCFQLFPNNEMVIETIHLVSPGRPEPYWKEISLRVLTSLRDEIQASSVVAVAQQKFQVLVEDVQKRLEASEAEVDLAVTDAEALKAIGDLLFQRYSVSNEGPDAKHAELVENFLSTHGDELVGSPKSGVRHNKFADFIPTNALKATDLLTVTNPSILTILVSCLNSDGIRNLEVSSLLTHVIFAAQQYEKQLLQRIIAAEDGKKHSGDGFSDSDDDSMGSDESSLDRNAANKSADEKGIKQCGHFIKYLIGRLEHLFVAGMSDGEKEEFLSNPGYLELICSLLQFASQWFERTARRISAPEEAIDHGIFTAVQSLTTALVASSTSKERKTDIQNLFFVGTVKAIIKHKALFERNIRAQGERSGRAARQKLCLRIASFLGTLTTGIGTFLSQNLSYMDKGFLMRALVIDRSVRPCTDTDTAGNCLSSDEYTLFCDGLLWLWKYASQPLHDVVQDGKDGIPTSQICSAFDRPMVKELRAPVAVALIGLCGSSSKTRQVTGEGEIAGSTGDTVVNDLCLSEFFDSDASANEWVSDEEDSDVTNNNRRYRELLRVVCHAVYCIDILFRRIDDKGALSLLADEGYGYEFGPVLPLVACRVLSTFADILLVEFNESTEIKKQAKLWAEEYPFSTREVGEVVDNNLHKVYRWLFGFVLVSESEKISGKDLATSVPSDLVTKKFVLESTTAAAQLYRCILRAYTDGRRAPPKAALELVSSALPDMEENEKSRVLKGFIFSCKVDCLSLSQVKALVTTGSGWDEPFAGIRSQLTEAGSDEEVNESYLSSTEEEIMMVRKGICSQLAKGPVPTSSSETGKSRSDTTQEDDRTTASRFEEEISRRFHATVDHLCLGNASDAESWYKAAQCATIKAELVADRLSLTAGYARNEDFSVPRSQSSQPSLIPLQDLEEAQRREVELKRSGWVAHLGEDLSLFTRFSWSSFASLRQCSQLMGENEFSKSTSDEESSRLDSWEKIEILFRKDKVDDWQQALGGLFVSSLRILSLRLMSVALFILRCKDDRSVADRNLDSELCEGLGTLTYSKLMASQEYGYPMHIIALATKREIAKTAKACFEKAVEQVSESMDDSASAGQATWDLLFMVGKCEEKIASTYCREAYFSSGTRRFEHHMSLALEYYSSALKQAQKIEEEGGETAGMEGGSSHGVSELFYRLHASRLKCLISAVSHTDPDVIERAELEALRLCEKFWFKIPEELSEEIEKAHVRDRVWKVLSDLVEALAQCRSDHQFFHRSVYRHAQALMWARVLYDPINGKSEGSLGTVPATRSPIIRGLNNSTNVAESAEAIIGSLFEGRRSQLCAVWLTVAIDTSPYEILNSSSRKYDSLRGKYISAYIESLRLNQRRSQLESFLKTILSSKRDLALHFQASAKALGGVGEKPHTHDSLLPKRSSALSTCFLTTIKREANSAFAEVLQIEISKASNDPKKVSDFYLKQAYACYLRLNCSVEDLQKLKDWKYGRLTIHEVEALCQAYFALGESKSPKKKNLMDWSGGATSKADILKSAVAKCRELIPNVTVNYFTKNTMTKARKAAATVEEPSAPDNNPSPSASGKRKLEAEKSQDSDKKLSGDDGPKKQYFEVKVPEDLESGSTFFTTVTLAGVSKKVKLTVPDGKPSSLRFSLPIPAKKAKMGDD